MAVKSAAELAECKLAEITGGDLSVDDQGRLTDREIDTVLERVPAWSRRQLKWGGERREYLLRPLPDQTSVEVPIGESTHHGGTMRLGTIKGQAFVVIEAAKFIRPSDMRAMLLIERSLAEHENDTASDCNEKTTPELGADPLADRPDSAETASEVRGGGEANSLGPLSKEALAILRALLNKRLGEIVPDPHLSQSTIHRRINHAKEETGTTTKEELVTHAIREGWFSIDEQEIPIEKADKLTEREKSVIPLLHLPRKQIASTLSISKSAVQALINRAYEKTGTRTSIQLMVLGARTGLVDFEAISFSNGDSRGSADQSSPDHAAHSVR